MIINNASEHHGAKLAEALAPKLAAGIKGSDEEIVSDCLDIARDLLRRFGSLLSKHYRSLLQAALPRLGSTRNIIQQRAINCLGALAPYIQVAEFDKTIEEIVSQLEKGGRRKAVYIQALGSLASHAGPKLGKHVSRITPLLVDAVNAEKEGDELSK